MIVCLPKEETVAFEKYNKSQCKLLVVYTQKKVYCKISRDLKYRVIFYFVPKVKANNFFDYQYFLMQFFANSSESLNFFIIV